MKAVGDLEVFLYCSSKSNKMKEDGKIPIRNQVLEQGLHRKSEQLSKCNESTDLTQRRWRQFQRYFE